MFLLHAASRPRKALLASCTFLLALTSAAAQTQDGVSQPFAPYSQQASAEVPAAPAHLAFVDGVAAVERDGQSQPAVSSAPFVPGDRLRTTRGRAEVLFPDGSVLDVDEDTAVDLQAPNLIRLVSGRVILIVAGAGNPASAVRYQIDTPVASARADGPGEYRVALVDGPDGIEAELAVLRGSGSLVTERGAIPISAGERSVARDGEAPSLPQAFNSARLDAFDRWSGARRNERVGTISARYLPRDLQMYGGTFDRYGSWQDTPQYGYVWYPSVAPDWQPYYYGYWAPYRQWGWTWIGLDFWAWPTHHFGRWGFFGHRWFWIPGSTWAPAWVTWGVAPEFVSWCPLGWDGRPVFEFSVDFAHRWNGWTVIPRNTFGLAARLDRFAVAPHQISSSTQFAFQRTPPVAVPRFAHAPSMVTAPIGRGPRWTSPSTSSAVAVPRVGQASRSSPSFAGAGAERPAVRPFKQPLSDSSGVPAYAVPRERAIPSSPAFSGRSPNRDFRGGVPMSPEVRAPGAVRRGGWPELGVAGPTPRSPQTTAPRAYASAPSPRYERQFPLPARGERQAMPRTQSQDRLAPVAAAPRYERQLAPAPRYSEHSFAPAPRYERQITPAPRYNERPFAPPPHYERQFAPPVHFERPASPPPMQMSPMPAPRSAPMAVPRSGNSVPSSGGPSHGGGSGESSSRGDHRRR